MASVVAGRYRLLFRLGAGGSWLALDELLGRRVAIRETPGPVSRVDHPGIAHIYDFRSADDKSYVVTEFVPAGSLHDAAPLTHPKAARVGLAVLETLRAVHAAGLRHGRVSPYNILLADDGRALLTDFAPGTGPAGDDLPALGRALRAAVHDSPGPVLPAAAALEAGEPAEILLRAAALGRTVRPPSPAPREPDRLRRSTRLTLIAALTLLIGTAGTALVVDALRSPETPSAAPPSVADLCDDRSALGSAVVADTVEQSYALPPGWLWHRDPIGFEVAVPAGWTRAADDTTACFRDPDSDRAYTVTSAEGTFVASWTTLDPDRTVSEPLLQLVAASLS